MILSHTSASYLHIKLEFSQSRNNGNDQNFALNNRQRKILKQMGNKKRMKFFKLT